MQEGRENVVTGLKRKWEEVDQDDEDKEEEKEGVRMVVVKWKRAEGEKKKDVAMQPTPLSQLLSFMTRGPPEARTQRK